MQLTYHLGPDDAAAALRADALAGLTATPKELPPRWFYDERGSELFDRITRLPEYYPTRAERAILEARSGEIAAASGADVLVELGSGTSEKTRLLLTALRAAGTLRRFVPFDVDPSVLRLAGDALAVEYPGLDVEGVVGDFTRHLGELPRAGRRMVAFLGSTIGNLAPAERSTVGSTSTGTNRRSRPARRSASSRSRVFSEVPLPSSTSTSAPDAAAISPARTLRMARSVRVG